MILCLQNLFGTGHIYLFSEEKNLLNSYNWKTTEEKPNLVQKISELFDKQGISPIDIHEFMVVIGPGPFTSVRTAAVIANLWKSQLQGMKLYAIPSGIYLREKYPEAEHLLLSAGKTAFFQFSKENPRECKKHPIAELQDLTGLYGGAMLPSIKIPDELKKAEKIACINVFQQLREKKKEFLVETIVPEYGADPNVS